MAGKLVFTFLISAAAWSADGARSDDPLTALKARSLRATKLEDLFTVYDATFLSVIWPKLRNGVHLTTEELCWEHLGIFFKQLSQGQPWAYSVVDATGRYPGGVYEGQRFWLGSKDQCLGLDAAFRARHGNATAATEQRRREKYFDGNAEDDWQSLEDKESSGSRVDRTPPVGIAFSAASVELNITRPAATESYNITLGVCLPRACPAEDVGALLRLYLTLSDLRPRRPPRAAAVRAVRRVPPPPPPAAAALALLAVALALLGLCLVATAVDYGLVRFRPRHCRSSFDVQRVETINVSQRLREAKLADVHGKRKEINLADLSSLSDKAKPAAAGADRAHCGRCGRFKKTPTADLPPKYSSLLSLSEDDKCRRRVFLRSVLLCFSLRQSWARLTSTSLTARELAAAHGARVLLTHWLVYLHVYVSVHYLAGNSVNASYGEDTYYTLAAGTFAFDSMFFVSGLLSAHHFFYLKSRYSVQQLVSVGGAPGRALQAVCFVSNRAVRLLPTYAFTVFLSAALARGEGAAAAVLPGGGGCEAHWWRSLLYVSNFYPAEEKCLQISWYLSLETQLHALGCALLSVPCARAAWGAALGALGAGVALDVFYSWHARGHVWLDSYSAYAALVETPWSRAAPYAAGALAGGLIHRLNGRLPVSKCKSALLWLLSLCVVPALLARPRLAPARGAAAALAPLAHAAWAPALLWPAVVLGTRWAGAARGLLNSRAVAALSRLSHSTLLLHGVLARALLLHAARTPALAAVDLLSWYASVAALSTAAALVLALLLETPCCSLLRRLSNCAA